MTTRMRAFQPSKDELIWPRDEKDMTLAYFEFTQF